MYVISLWRIQEFQNRGLGPGAVEFLGPLYFNPLIKVHVYVCYLVKIDKNNHKKYFKQGDALGAGSQ